ncbi:MAG: mannose-1-phosphate guanylyltransferase [Treponema sp.]|nr:mannose-1-phosphate guanylyltransferase [Treponema sp.]
MFSDIIILAGGFGERLWPASRPDFPKQFMTLGGHFSFLQQSVRRALALEPSGKILIATRSDLLERMSLQCKELLTSSLLSETEREKLKTDLYIIAEPEPKHTTAPVILCCHFLDKLFPLEKHTVLVLTSDHIIEPVAKFVSDAEKAAAAAESGFFVCFAIPPLSASTGYGYIKTGKSDEKLDTVYQIENFKEKPDQKTAESYVRSGNYWWNSGMFGFTAEFLEKELAVCSPEISQAFEVVQKGMKPEIAVHNSVKFVSRWPEMTAAYAETPAMPLDISIAEKTDYAYAVRASFSWDDVGSWDSFAEHCENNEGEMAVVDSSGCFIYSDLPVALCGVKDISVIIKNGKVLVMKKGKSDCVRAVVKIMNDKGIK